MMWLAASAGIKRCAEAADAARPIQHALHASKVEQVIFEPQKRPDFSMPAVHGAMQNP
jgi:hypothetical protein